jgi:hypothetical protein
MIYHNIMLFAEEESWIEKEKEIIVVCWVGLLVDCQEMGESFCKCVLFAHMNAFVYCIVPHEFLIQIMND